MSEPTAVRPQDAKAAHRQMREVNRSLVLGLLRRGGRQSRVDLARATGLSKPTVSAIVEDLLRDELVLELGPATPRPGGGRPAGLLVYNGAAEALAGIRFGAHNIHVAVGDGTERDIGAISRPVPASPEAAVDEAARMVRDVLRDHPASRLRCVGVAIAGLVESETGRCAIAPNLGWHDVPIGELIAARLDAPTLVVNSTVAAAHAEGVSGAAQGVQSFVWAYVGTGIGAGIVSGGQALLGSRGFAGEVGHCRVVDDGPLCGCGNRGCLETVASTPAILRSVTEAIAREQPTVLAANLDRLNVAGIAAAAAAGDEVAQEALRVAGHHLGRGLSYLVNILNPSLVVVGGPLASAGQRWLDAVRAAVNDSALQAESVPVVATAIGDRAPLDGARDMAARRFTPSYRIVAGGVGSG